MLHIINVFIIILFIEQYLLVFNYNNNYII